MRLLLFILGVALALPAAHAARDSDRDGDASSEIQQLIAELGSDQYAVRRRAEERLLRFGPEAFDELSAAADDEDLEIAERIGYITQRLRVQWIHADDSADVRRVFTQYGEQSEDARGERVRALADLDDHAGAAALCRVARFDASPLVARRAALAILELKLSADERRANAAAWQAELGASERPAVEWIRLYLRELDEPAAAIADWAKVNAAETKLLKDDAGVTDFYTVRDLLIRQLDRCNDLALTPETTAALLAVIDLTNDSDDPDQIKGGIAWALRWIIKEKSWDVLTQIEEKFESRFRRDRSLLYYLAAASAKSGSEARGRELAERAFNLSADDEDERVAVANVVADLGFVDWAEREYRRMIDAHPVTARLAMEARSKLAVWLHDREDYQAAADLLGEFCDAIDGDDATRRRLIGEIDEETGAGRETIREIQARHLFYMACVDAEGKDYDAQRRHLEEAVAKYDQDPDILIAMYRSPGASDDFRQRTRVRIRGAAKYMQSLVNEVPTEPSFYNQWAWLIANTEGDQQKAVEYSLKSLELSPEEPSYLDTLGRCYYAVGDYENAVKSQTKAVELAPHYQVMKRQLALFQRALAEQSAD